MRSIVMLATTIACTLSLTACGGGGDNGPSSDNNSGNNPGSNSGGSGSSTPVYSYEAQPAATDANSFLALLNSEGTRGYGWLRNQTFSDGAKAIFVNAGVVPTYTCEMLPIPTAESDEAGPQYTAQANTEGAKGYYVLDNTGFYSDSFYCQNGGSTAQYSYANAAVPSSVSDFQNQLNQWGQSGYYFNIQLVYESTQIVNETLYEKNTASASTYTYAVLTPPTDLNDFLAQINNEGAQGYEQEEHNLLLNYSPYNVTGSGINVMIYEKNLSQSVTFTHLSDTLPATSTDFITQANNYATQGYRYAGYVTFSGQLASIYVKTNN